jgi:hypothetical protein
VLNLFNDKSVQTLRELVAWWRSRSRVGAPDVDEDLESHMAPEMYVAQAPEDDGIPGRVHEIPGMALECQIFESVGGVLSPVPGLKATVLNLGEDEIEPLAYVPVTRDKFGEWWVCGASGGGGMSISGCPKDPQDQNTGTSVGCLEFDCEEKLVPLVRVMRFKTGVFVVKNESELGVLAGDVTGTGSGTGTGGHGVFIDLGGMDIDIEYVRKTFFCVDICDTKDLHGVMCFRSGVLMDHYFVDECETCDCTTGTAGDAP